MRYVSIAAAAREAGISRQAMHQAVRREAVPVDDRNMIDLDNDVVRAWIAKRNRVKPGKQSDAVKSARQRAPAAQKPDTKPVETPPPVAAGADPEPYDPVPESKPYAPVSAEKLAAYDISDRKKLADAIKVEMANAQTRGELVRQESVREVINKLWTVDTTQWTQIGSRIAPDVAGALGVDDPEAEIRVRKIIDEAVYSVMANTQKIIERWLSDEVIITPDELGVDAMVPPGANGQNGSH